MTVANKAFTTTLHERNEATNLRLTAINTRITELDEKFEKEKEEILLYVDERGAELTRMLNQFKVGVHC
jgi:chaperonin cofactor prefoldin